MRAFHGLGLCLALIACCPALAAAEGQADSARVAGWRGDLDFWLRALGSQHYVLRRGPLPDSLIRRALRFRREVPAWSDERALAELMRLSAMAGDGHTYVLPWGAAHVFAHVIPLRLYAFADGMFVIDAEPGQEQWIGAKVLTLAGIPEADLLPRITPFCARDNPTGVLWAGPVLLRFRGYLEALTGRRLTDVVPVTLRMRDGRDTSLALRLVPAPPLRGVPKLIPSRLPGAPPPPRYLRAVSTTFWYEAVDDTTLYVQLNQVSDDPHETLAAFAGRLADEIARSHMRLVVVDVRHNSGGNLGLLDPLVTVLRDFTSGSNAGRLVVLCGRNTFSAAQVFLTRAEHEARAEIAGEPSSSRPNFVGEENTVVLPWSGAITSISNRYHETIPGDRRLWIEPRPRIAISSADYFANRDPLLDAVLNRDGHPVDRR